MVSWSSAGSVSFGGDAQEAVFVILSNPHGKVEKDEAAVIQLERIGLRPRGLKRRYEEDSSTDFETEDKVPAPIDPTAEMEEIIMSKEWANSGPPPKGAGWWGRGAPIQVHAGHRQRNLEDGLGLCSPGRWRPKNRTLPELDDINKGFLVALGLDWGSWSTTVTKMMLGRVEASPFTEAQICAGHSYLEKWVQRRGQSAGAGPKDRAQGPKIRLLQAFLRLAGDPDAAALDSYAEGVKLGYKLRMPRTPAVFEENALAIGL